MESNFKDFLSEQMNDPDFREEYENGSINLLNCEEFQNVCYFIDTIFSHYMELHHDKKVKDFYDLFRKSLNNFAVGKDCEYFAFHLVYSSLEKFSYKEEHEHRFINFDLEPELISISESSYYYDPLVGGDSSDLWNYNLWNNGEEGVEDSYFLLFTLDSIIEFIDMGARLEIDVPEEFHEEE